MNRITEFNIYYSMVFGAITTILFVISHCWWCIIHVPQMAFLISLGIWVGGIAVMYLGDYYKNIITKETIGDA
jgi:hypothetical protein